MLPNIFANEHLKDKIFDSYIRQDIALMESPAFGKTIFEYAPKSNGAKDFKAFTNEFLKKFESK